MFLNGKSQGRIRKWNGETGEWDEQKKQWNNEHRLDRYRLRWNDVKYEPGELRVVVYDEKGQNRGEQVLRTAGKPAQLQLDTWTQHDGTTPRLKADGEDLAFVTVSLQDKDGNFVPTATDQLRFEVTGAGTFRACCNGDATSLEPFTQPTMRLFAGQLVVVVQAARQSGMLTLKVTDDQLGISREVAIRVE